MDDQMQVGMIGLGLMGTAMSGRLLAAGHGVHGYDAATAACDAHVQRGGTVGGSIAEVVAACGLVILSLPNGEVVRQVCLGPGGVLEAAGEREHTVVIDTTTAHPDVAGEVAARLATAGVTLLDVGISGNSAMVARGDALGVVGGDLQAAPWALDVLGTFCREVAHVGGTGDGMRAKLVINHILLLNRLALAEGLVLAEALGMDLPATLSVVRASGAYSRAMDMWGARMVARDYHPPASRVSNGNKDMQLILDLAREAGAPTPALGQLDLVVRAMLANGLGPADNAAVAEMLRVLGGFGDLAAATGSTP